MRRREKDRIIGHVHFLMRVYFQKTFVSRKRTSHENAMLDAKSICDTHTSRREGERERARACARARERVRVE